MEIQGIVRLLKEKFGDKLNTQSFKKLTSNIIFLLTFLNKNKVTTMFIQNFGEKQSMVLRKILTEDDTVLFYHQLITTHRQLFFVLRSIFISHLLKLLLSVFSLRSLPTVVQSIVQHWDVIISVPIRQRLSDTFKSVMVKQN